MHVFIVRKQAVHLLSIVVEIEPQRIFVAAGHRCLLLIEPGIALQIAILEGLDLLIEKIQQRCESACQRVDQRLLRRALGHLAICLVHFTRTARADTHRLQLDALVAFTGETFGPQGLAVGIGADDYLQALDIRLVDQVDLAHSHPVDLQNGSQPFHTTGVTQRTHHDQQYGKQHQCGSEGTLDTYTIEKTLHGWTLLFFFE
ncbi:hypothetical protein D9M71_590320 [compost metagenome]